MVTRAKGKVGVIAPILAVALLAATPSAPSFDPGIHRDITRDGLGPKLNDSFLRTAVRRDINHQHRWMDAGLRGAADERHFDDCEFNGSARFIRAEYAAARAALSAEDPWRATEAFGRILHTVQDFYSHSNWVELGFPVRDGEATQSDLVDLSGAQASLAQPWFAPAGGKEVRSDILLGADDWMLPNGWSIKRNGGGTFIPTVVDPQGRRRGRLLVTGKGAGDHECTVHAGLQVVYPGIRHANLNKDNPTAGASDVDTVERQRKHANARALATLQTGYEWCRLVREAAEVNQDGLLLALWVRPGGNPHPPRTPCAQTGPGPTPIVVTIESIRILHSRDGDDDPGEIQLAAVLYDDPRDFHRSVHVTNRNGRMVLKAGDFVPPDQLPAPLTLCVARGRGATFSLYAWDNDDPQNDEYALDFDNYDDDDEVLLGFQRVFGAELPSAEQVVRSRDLEVRFRLGRTVGGVAGVLCPPAASGAR